jgi:hypothetical protein
MRMMSCRDAQWRVGVWRNVLVACQRRLGLRHLLIRSFFLNALSLDYLGFGFLRDWYYSL